MELRPVQMSGCVFGYHPRIGRIIIIPAPPHAGRELYIFMVYASI
jgi:hypothetical protein